MHACTPHFPLLPPISMFVLQSYTSIPCWMMNSVCIQLSKYVLVLVRISSTRFALHTLCRFDLGIKFVGYFIAKVWFMQSADHRGGVTMHVMSVCEYGHWFINNASVTNTICILYLSKIPNAIMRTFIGSTIITETNCCLQRGLNHHSIDKWYVLRFSIGWM